MSKCKFFDDDSESCGNGEVWKLIGRPAGFDCFVRPFWCICRFYEDISGD